VSVGTGEVVTRKETPYLLVLVRDGAGVDAVSNDFPICRDSDGLNTELVRSIFPVERVRLGAAAVCTSRLLAYIEALARVGEGVVAVNKSLPARRERLGLSVELVKRLFVIARCTEGEGVVAVNSAFEAARVSAGAGVEAVRTTFPVDRDNEGTRVVCPSTLRA
jgi:hypothetical protein